MTKELTQEEREMALEARRKYNREAQRKFREKNPDAAMYYWLKKAKEEQLSEKEGVGNDE